MIQVLSQQHVGSGTASASTFLRGDQTYAEAGGGSLIKIGEASTTSAAASLTVDNCFTTTYDMYRVIGFLTPSSAGAHCLVRWRTGGASGSTYSTANYSWITEGQYIQSSGPSSAQYLNWNYSADAARVASDCGDGTDKAVLF